MIPELGTLALALAFMVTLVQTGLPLAGAHRGRVAWMALARPAAAVQFGCVALAFACLAWSFYAIDFSVAYVANNANSILPWYYRLTAVWGGHEGSMLLWMLTLSGWTLAVAVASRSLPLQMVARVLAVLGFVSAGFLLFILLTSNPFARLTPAPVEGGDLNPLLQDVGMIIHPPMLYMGYVGMAVAFGFAIAALIGGRLDAAWARWTRPWVTVAWVFLTAGVALGSWWAYYELGWGGWWFWDPVENASFMPWLVATALIHSLAVTEKRGAFKSWTVLLAILAFSLSLLGTFLVRSGVLTSVHAFASDPARGVYILAFLGVVIGGSLLLYAIRGPSTLGGSRFEWLSRETMLLGNNVLLIVATGTVLLGTLYPLAIDAVGGGKLSVGPPYFNAVFLPLMMLLLALLGFGQLVRYRRDTAARIVSRMRYAVPAALALGIGIAAMIGDGLGTVAGTALGLALAAWVVFGAVQAVRSQLTQQRALAGALSRLPAGVYGMALAHIGLAVTVVGITISAGYAQEQRLRMEPGQGAELAGYRFVFEGVETRPGPNYRSQYGTLRVTRGQREVAVLHPEKRSYASGGRPMTEAGIDGGFLRDLYVSLGEPLDETGAWSVRLYHKPMVRWIWLGAALMALGGLVAVSDRRYRSARRARETAPSDADAARA
ncbi:MAG: heme lyase CcmF/NrfE family subunit [Deinococcus-Thermus bacterium]|nr:heme lyase CcmF/NrfE family subunit [Deinococcota bacterium]